VINLSQALTRLSTDFKALEIKWALVGGLAVSVLVEPRTTRDVDVAVAVSNDREAERIALSLRSRGYRDHPEGNLLEQEYTDRLAGLRFLAPGEEGDEEEGPVIDLLFASSGVEPEIVAAAEVLEILPGFAVPVIQPGHLLAVKVLAGRTRDLDDARDLLKSMSEAEILQARETLDLIQRRGFHRGKNLQMELARLIEDRLMA
jgi:hypothetical protein